MIKYQQRPWSVVPNVSILLSLLICTVLSCVKRKVEVELTQPVGSLQLEVTVGQEDGLLLGYPQVLGIDHHHIQECYHRNHHLVPNQTELGALFSCSDSEH